MTEEFDLLKLKDMVVITTNKGRRLLRVNSIKNLHPATGIPYQNYPHDKSPDFSNGFFSFDDKQFIKSFGNISIEEFNTKYPEYTF